jgi:hypothetical protein
MAWAAGNPFIGEWKLDPTKSRLPDEMKIQSDGGNKYTFDFAGDPETIVVDGSDQPGGYGGTLLSVKPEAPDTWIVQRKKDGKLLLKATWKLSKDGNTLSDYFRGFEPDGSTLSMDYVYQRTGGGSGFAADWQSIKETMNSPFSIQVKSFQGDGLSFINPSEHRTKNVKFDGKDYPVQGSRSTASIRRVNDRSLEMTDKFNGKVTDTQQIELSPDDKILTLTIHAVGQSRPNILVFDRQ